MLLPIGLPASNAYLYLRPLHAGRLEPFGLSPEGGFAVINRIYREINGVMDVDFAELAKW